MSTLEVSDLTKAYGATKVLEGISFTLRPGGCTALIGPNGAGKSTLVECIAGLRRIDRGRVSIDHRDVTDDIQALRSLLYICMQKQPAAKYVRVGEMIDLMRNIYASPRSVPEILDAAGLAGNKRQYIHKLSGGERLRLEIACSLIAERSIIIYDELTSGLDPLGRRDVYRILGRLKRESRTILYITHYLEEVHLICDSVIALNNARLTFFDSPRNIPDHQCFYDLYRKYTPREVPD